MTSDTTPDDETRDPRDARIQKLEHRMNDMVHAAELRELIEQWRYDCEQRAGMARKQEVAEAFEQCADELEAVIEGEHDEP